MDNLDTFQLICSYLTDIEFITFISASKKLCRPKSKVLTNNYILSEIIDVTHIYDFSDITYGYLYWNSVLVPLRVEILTFVDEFNCELTELDKFKCLKKINIGIYYTNPKLLHGVLPQTININELVMTYIINKIIDRELIPHGFFMSTFQLANYTIINNNIENITTIKGFTELIQNNIQNVQDFNKYIDVENRYERIFFIDIMVTPVLDQLVFMKFYIKKMCEHIMRFRDKLSICDQFGIYDE